MAKPDAWSGLAAVTMFLAGAVGSVRVNAQAAASRLPVSADQVIAANIASRGGLAHLERVRTEKLRGSITFSDGTAHLLSSDLARPVRIRTEITFDSGRLIQAYDGRTAWTVNPLGSHADPAPRVLPTGEALNVAAGGDMDGPLVGYKRKGNRVIFAGLDTADGRPAYRLDVVTASGLHDSYFIDASSHLQTKWRGHRVMNGEPVVFESYFRDYRRVGGVMIAFQIDSDTQGKTGSQRIRLRTVLLNSTLPDEEFEFPGRRRTSDEGILPTRHRSYPVELEKAVSLAAPNVRVAEPSSPATMGVVTEDSLNSPALGVNKNFIVYLPRSFRSDRSRRLPELVVSVDSVYRTIPDAWHRTVASPSVGGIGAGLEGWRADDPVWMVRRAMVERQPIAALWLIVGTEDERTGPVNRLFHRTLATLAVPNAYIEAAGGLRSLFGGHPQPRAWSGLPGPCPECPVLHSPHRAKHATDSNLT